MKKTLLTLAACALGFSAYAEDPVVINFENATSENVVGTYVAEVLPEGDKYGSAEHWQPLESIALQGYTFTFTFAEGSKNQPALYGSTTASAKTEKTVRIYTGTTMTIAAPEGVTVSKIEFLGSGNKVSKKTTCSTGSLATGTEYNGTVGKYNATWTGSANSISITTEEQWRFSEVTIYTGEAGNEGGDEPENPVDNGSVTLLEATNANSADGWTLGAENLPEGLTYVWMWKNYNGAYYLAASAFAGGAANEASEFAVSPALEITATGDASMSFEHAAKFQTTLTELCYVAAREVGATEWTKLTVTTWPEAGSWAYANSGNIDLSAFKGKKIELGFHYGSSATGADTWQIRNVIVVGGKLAGTSTPDEPEKPVEKTTFSKTTSTADLVSGSKYIFAVDNLVSAPINETYNYGRLSLSEGTFVDSKIEAPTANALTLTQTENGWTIQDASNRYYSMQGTYTTFQMYTEAAESSYWTIEYNADGTVTILNALNDDYVISRGKGDQSWFNTLSLTQLTESAVLGETYALPCLYIEGEVSSIESTIATENAPVEYFNLQGVRVANPENGLFIRRQGNKVSKVVL